MTEEQRIRKNEQAAKYREKNRIKVREAQKRYREGNWEKVYAREKAWRKKNAKRHYISTRKHFKKFEDKYKILAKRWISLNKEKHLQYSYKSKKKRYKIDPKYKAHCNLRSKFYNILKSNRRSHHFELIGCTLQDFLNYLESLFKPGMTWDNWSVDGWHIDHIIPLSSFDLTDPEQQKACFHYTNTQPLWAKENVEKGTK